MILVYTHQISSRVRYIFRTLFQQFMNSEVRFTSQVEEFIAYDGIKISYTKNPLGNELFFRSHTILFEKGISDQDIQVKSWNGQKVFFGQSENENF